MRFFSFIPVKLSCYLILGILIGFYLQPKLLFASILLGISLLFLYLTYRVQTRDKFPFFGILTACTTIILGVFTTTVSSPKNHINHYSKHSTLTHELWTLKVREVLKPNAFSYRYIVAAKYINNTQVTGPLLVNVQKDSTDNGFKVDDEIVVFSKTTGINPPLNPRQFDYRNYLKKLGIYHQIHIKNGSFLQKKKSSKTLFGIASNFRENLIQKLKQENFDAQELGVIQALLLGQRNTISEDTYSDYKNAGAVHILAVSGLHVGILLLVLQFLLKPIEQLPKGKTIKLITIVILLWAFAFVAGLSPSVVRAVTMFSFLAYALYLNRPTSTFNILALSVFFILLIKPRFLFQVGFQMSYAAVFAIVWVYPKLQRFWYPKNWLVRKVWQLLSVSFAAQLGVLPLSLFYFHQFPALFFVSNLLIVPFLGIILGVGILVLVLAGLNLLFEPLVVLYNSLIGFMNSTISWVARQESFLFKDIPFDTVQLFIGYFGVIALILVLSKSSFKNVSALALGIIGFQGYLVFTTYTSNKKEGFVLVNQTANSVILHQKGSLLEVYSHKNEPLEYLLSNYRIAERIASIKHKPLQNSYGIAHRKLYIVDSMGVYPSTGKVDYLLLTQSPKINLERLLNILKPDLILVDASNYKSYVKRWKATCLKKEIPFHYTGEKGAYYFDMK